LLPVQLIRKKRDGNALDDAELRWFIDGVTNGTIADYQIAAMLMAIFFNGLDDRELATWADAMTRSGDVLDLSRIARPKIDKHSTGGVGDKISIPLAPAVAACGVCVPMVSGRGLGHTGGTLDKLESIPGFRVDLSVERFTELVDKLGLCLIGQTKSIAPADKRLYALRDVTATVESLPLIASSIMSKKLAEGIDGLVIDCKVGRGAFMKTIERARELCDRAHDRERPRDPRVDRDLARRRSVRYARARPRARRRDARARRGHRGSSDRARGDRARARRWQCARAVSQARRGAGRRSARVRLARLGAAEGEVS